MSDGYFVKTGKRTQQYYGGDNPETSSKFKAIKSYFSRKAAGSSEKSLAERFKEFGMKITGQD